MCVFLRARPYARGRVYVCVHVEQQLRVGVGMAAAAAAVVGVLCVFGCACCQFAVCQQ